MRKAKMIVTVVLAVLVLILIFQNWKDFPVSFFFWSGSLPGTIMLLLTLAVGFVIGIIATTTWLKNKDS